MKPFKQLLKSETILYAIYDHEVFRKSVTTNTLWKLAATFMVLILDVSKAAALMSDYVKWKHLIPRYGTIIFKSSVKKFG